MPLNLCMCPPHVTSLYQGINVPPPQVKKNNKKPHQILSNLNIDHVYYLRLPPYAV